MADLIDLRPDGTARLTLGGRTVTLKRPTIGQVRSIQDATIDAGDRAADIAVDHAEKVREAAVEHGVDVDADPVLVAAGRVLGWWPAVADQFTEQDAESRTLLVSQWCEEAAAGAQPDQADDPSADRDWRRTLRGMNREMSREQQVCFFEIGRLLIKTLGTGSFTLPDDDDDLDPMLGGPQVYTRLIRGWTDRPLG